MIYYQNGNILIRNMEDRDAQPLADAEVAQGWLNSTADKFRIRLLHQAQGKSIALVAELDGEPVGYVHLYLYGEDGPFAGRGIPEIVDFAVLDKFRCRGVGSALMDAAEKIAASHSDTVYLGVGLHYWYGPAQRLYFKRGYAPDGSGVWFHGQVCEPYSQCCNDDDLVLYLVKKLK